MLLGSTSQSAVQLEVCFHQTIALKSAESLVKTMMHLERNKQDFASPVFAELDSIVAVLAVAADK